MATRVQTLRSKLQISPDSVNDRPAIGPHVASVMAHWSAVETTVISLVASLLGFEYRSGMIMYAALEGDAARNAVTMALLSSKLPKQMQERWVGIWQRLKEPRSDRNALAHWLYAASDDYPDDILLVEPRSHKKWAMAGSAIETVKHKIQVSEHRKTMAMLQILQVYRYTSSDLSRVASSLSAISIEMFSFSKDAQDHVLRSSRSG